MLYAIPNYSQFREHYGLDRNAMAHLAVETEIDLVDLLGTFAFLKVYPIYHTYVGRKGSQLDSTTAQNNIWQVLNKLTDTFVYENVTFEYPHTYGWYQNRSLAIDATHVPLTGVPHTMNGDQHPYFSWKRRKNATSWQTIFDIVHDRVVHVAGPYPASFNDARIYNLSQVCSVIITRLLCSSGGRVTSRRAKLFS